MVLAYLIYSFYALGGGEGDWHVQSSWKRRSIVIQVEREAPPGECLACVA